MLEAGAYVAIALLVWGDAVFPVLPGETTMVTGGVLASTGDLRLGLVILAGAVGAIVGDSSLYWIGRSQSGRIRRWTSRTFGEKRLARGETLFVRRGGLLVAFGRFMPGLRFVANLSAGSLKYPYRSFLGFSIVGGVLWAVYASALGFFVAEAVGNVWVSLGISLAASMAIGVLIVLLERRDSRRRAEAQAG